MSKLSDTYKSSFGNVSEAANKIGAQISFKATCGMLIIKAYKKFKAKSIYQVTWEEDTFSANLKVELETICSDENFPYHITFQDHQITDTILSGAVSSKTGKKIDIVFSTFYKPKALKYGIEAKILCENNSGTRRANHLSEEYVVSGIDRFVTKNYEIDGCMVGYVINGDADKIVKNINQVLLNTNRKVEQLSGKHTIEEYTNCYDSSHSDFSLKHFILYFS